MMKATGTVQRIGADAQPMEFICWKDETAPEFFAKIGGEMKKVSLIPVVPHGCRAFNYGGEMKHPYGGLDVVGLTPCYLMPPPLIDEDLLEGIIGLWAVESGAEKENFSENYELARRKFASTMGEPLLTKSTDGAAHKKASKHKENVKTNRHSAAEQKAIQAWASANDIDLSAMAAEQREFYFWLHESAVLDEHAKKDYRDLESSHLKALASAVRYRVELAGGVIAFAADWRVRTLDVIEREQFRRVEIESNGALQNEQEKQTKETDPARIKMMPLHDREWQQNCIVAIYDMAPSTQEEQYLELAKRIVHRLELLSKQRAKPQCDYLSDTMSRKWTKRLAEADVRKKIADTLGSRVRKYIKANPPFP